MKRETPKANKTALASCVGSPNFSEASWGTSPFRDYVSVELLGHQRFIPVRSDDSRILTCFLEYHQEFVEVHDLLHYKDGTQWAFKASSYCKLRLDKNWLIKQMGELGLAIIQDTFSSGMVNIVAKKTGSA